MPDETKPDRPKITEETANVELDIADENITSTGVDTVADLVSSLSLPTWIARNASKAFRQLCSAAVEWPSAFFKGKASERHAITAADTKITEAVTDQIIQQIDVPPEYAQIAVKKHVEKIIGEQVNLDKISAITANELKNGESDNPVNQPNEAQSADSTNQDANSEEEKTISDVWLNIFETEARPQSTEEGQLLFGRILAGEIRQPGSYSIKAVKTLGEFDQNTAILFKKICSLSTGLMRSFGNISIQVITLENAPLSSQTLEKYGMSYDALSTLEQYGLISDANFSYWHLENFPILFRHQGQNWLVSPIASNEEKNQQLKLYGVQLSQAARELYRLVDQEPMPEYTEDLKKFLVGQNLSITEVDIISTDKNKGVTLLKTKPKHDRS